MLREYFTYRLSITTYNNVNHAGGYAGALRELAQGESRKRRASIGFDYDSAACSHGRSGLSRDHCVREIPRSDAANDTDWLLVNLQSPIIRHSRNDVTHDAFTLFGIKFDKSSAVIYFAYGLSKGLALFGRHQHAKVIGVL